MNDKYILKWNRKVIIKVFCSKIFLIIEKTECFWQHINHIKESVKMEESLDDIFFAIRQKNVRVRTLCSSCSWENTFWQAECTRFLCIGGCRQFFSSMRSLVGLHLPKIVDEFAVFHILIITLCLHLIIKYITLSMKLLFPSSAKFISSWIYF